MSEGQAFRELAKKLVELDRRVTAVSTPQLAHSSLEDAAVNTYDEEGQLSAVIGKQYDGTYGAVSVAGPTPPKPDSNGITVAPVPGGALLNYIGTWESAPTDPGVAPTPVVAPQDFKLFEVHASTDPAFSALLFSTKKADLLNARGGEVLVSLERDVDHYFRIIARSESGKVGAASDVVGPFRAGKMVESDLDIDWDKFGGTTVFYGDATPTAKAIGDLWLQTPANVSHRWDGDSWEPVRDQGITQALLDASQAAQDAEQAGLDALAAQGAAEAAQEAADSKITVYRQATAPAGGTYKVNADLWIDSDDGKLYVTTTTTGNWVEAGDQRIATALSTAQGKTTVFAQTSAPSTTGRTIGDVWVDTDDANKWYDWVGGTTPKWQVRQWGAGAISATARQLGAITTYRQASAPTTGMIVGDFWIDSDDNVIYRYEGTTPTWVKSQDIAINQAIQAAATAQSTADGKVRIFVQTSAPTGLVAGDVGDMWIDTDDSNVSYTWSGTAWDKRQLGNGAIQPKSLVASDVVATGTVTAALFEALLVLTTEVIAGNPAGTHARLTPTGIRVYAEDLVDGIPNEVIRLGTDTNDYFGISDSNGALVASVDETGRGSFSNLNVQGDPIFQGVTLSEQMSEAQAGRIMGFFRGNFTADVTPVNTEIGLVEVNAYLEAGRSYSIRSHFGWFQNIPNQEAVIRIRSTRAAVDGDDTAPAPTITSTLEERWWRTHEATDRTYTEDVELLYNCTRTGRHRFLLTIDCAAGPTRQNFAECSGLVNIVPTAANTPTQKRVNFPWVYDDAATINIITTPATSVPGTTVTGTAFTAVDTSGFNVVATRTNTTSFDVHWYARGPAYTNGRITVDATILTTMAIIDAGPTPPTSGQQTAGGGVIGTNAAVPTGGTAAPAPTQPSSPSTTKQQYYTELGPVGKVSWRGDNSVRTDLGAWGVQQGNDPSGYNGIGKGAYWFNLPSITGTVDRVDIYLYSEHWYYNSGGTAVLNINDQRGADPNMYKMRGDWLVGGYAKPGGKWVTVPADWEAFFKGTNNNTFNGRATTITLGPTNTDLLYYGRFTDCRLRIWYTQ